MTETTLLAWARMFLQNGLAAWAQSGVVLALGLLAAWALRRRGPAAVSLACRAALAGVGATLLITALPCAPFSPAVRLTLPAAPVTAPTVTLPVADAPFAAVPIETTDAPTAAAPPADTDAADVPMPTASADPLPPAPPSIRPAVPLANRIYLALAALWLLGTFAQLAWIAICQLSLARLRGQATVIADPRYADLCRQQGIARPPTLVVHPRLRNPFLAGTLRPTLFLPTSYAEDFAPDTLRAIFAHELAHAARRDCVWTLAGRLCAALLWPQPLLWLLLRRSESAGEQVCDQSALAAGCPPPAYADCLLRLAERGRPPRRARTLAAGIVPFRSALARRIQQILERNPQTMPPLTARLRLAVALSAVLAVGTSLLLVSSHAAPPAASLAQTPLSPAFARQLAQAQDIRAHYEDWAINHRRQLTRMTAAGPHYKGWAVDYHSQVAKKAANHDGLTALMAVYDSLRDSRLGTWPDDPRIGRNGAEPAFAALTRGLTLAHLERSQEWIDRRIRDDFAKYRDLRVAESVGIGRQKIVYWASGRITQSTTTSRFVGHGLPLDNQETQQEIIPAFFGSAAQLAHFQTAAPAPETPQPAAAESMIHMKQLMLATLQYVQDYDDVYPRARAWGKGLYPYLKNKTALHDPLAPSTFQYGYAMNRALNQTPAARVTSPASAIALFESTKDDLNANDQGASLARPGRLHAESFTGNYYGFADGHVKALSDTAIPSFTPSLSKPITAPRRRLSHSSHPTYDAILKSRLKAVAYNKRLTLITGRLLNANGSPAVHLLIGLVYRNDHWACLWAITNSEGVYQFAPLQIGKGSYPLGDYELRTQYGSATNRLALLRLTRADSGTKQVPDIHISSGQHGDSHSVLRQNNIAEIQVRPQTASAQFGQTTATVRTVQLSQNGPTQQSTPDQELQAAKARRDEAELHYQEMELEVAQRNADYAHQQRLAIEQELAALQKAGKTNTKQYHVLKRNYAMAFRREIQTNNQIKATESQMQAVERYKKIISGKPETSFQAGQSTATARRSAKAQLQRLAFELEKAEIAVGVSHQKREALKKKLIALHNAKQTTTKQYQEAEINYAMAATRDSEALIYAQTVKNELFMLHDSIRSKN